ncbi:MAG: fibrobacter succinogenes major paralogous domain-containing protein [Bacteroidota bacterium]
MKPKTWIYIFILMGFVVMISGSCTKDEDPITTVRPPMPLTVKDIDGNVYHTVKIGNQVWMLENLKTTRYNNGDIIPNITDSTEWLNTHTGAWCSYLNSTANNVTYGKLYNFKVVSSGNIAPVGWHVPTKNEWETLIIYLDNDISGKLKETGTIHWITNNGASNQSGFTALPGGYCGFESATPLFKSIGLNGNWWSSSTWINDNIFNYYILGWTLTLDGGYLLDKQSTLNGYSIRCIFNWTY